MTREPKLAGGVLSWRRPASPQTIGASAIASNQTDVTRVRENGEPAQPRACHCWFKLDRRLVIHATGFWHPYSLLHKFLKKRFTFGMESVKKPSHMEALSRKWGDLESEHMLNKLGILTGCLLVFACCLESRGAIIAQYPFTGSSLASTDSELHSSAGNITLGAGLSTSSGSFSGTAGNPSPGFIMYKNDLAGAFDINNNDYISFVVTANSGWVLNLNGNSAMTFDFASGQINKGVNWAVRSSVDNYGANIATGSTTATTFSQGTVNLADSYNNLSTITFRIYGWNPANVDLLFDNITLNGVVAVPEPVNIALAAFGLGAVGLGIGRRIYLRSRA